MRALDSADDFPLGWNTELAEVFKKSGMELYERRQKLVWVLRIVSAYSDEPPKVIVCRSRAAVARARARVSTRPTLCASMTTSPSLATK